MKPNFLIIGAAKSGTTSLFNYLSQHPEISVPKNKEPKYFALKDSDFKFKGNKNAIRQIEKTTVKTKKDYLKLFENFKTKYCGEASPIYFHYPAAAENIYRFDPGMKMIVILRNPVERAYSDWKHNYRMGFEPISNFGRALLKTSIRKEQNYIPYLDYLEKGLYGKHLENFLKYFPNDQLKVLFFDDLELNANKVCNDVLKFLGLEDSFTFNTSEVFMSSKPLYKNKFFKKVNLKFNKYWLTKHFSGLGEISQNLALDRKRYLQNFYRDDLLLLQDLTERNLSDWMH